jgi:uncharacterized RDD family membrane protein YckC
MSEPVLDSSPDQSRSDRRRKPVTTRKKRSSVAESKGPSTLIEFPGASRAIPEWRKQLSQRVREVQERRAREAAAAAARQASNEKVACALPSAQLELVPDPEQPAMKPIVSKALERLERARHIIPENEIAAIVDELIESHSARKTGDEPGPRKGNLTVVPVPPPVECQEESAAVDTPEKPAELVPGAGSDNAKKPVRLIADGVEDQALSYLESCLTIPAVDFYPSRKPAGLLRRMAGGLIDLLCVAALIGLCGAAIYAAGADWSDPRGIEFLVGAGIVLIFSYFTVLIALTGRTWGMRLFSLRTIDRRTGLIPSGGQAVKRALGYTLSVLVFGLGFVYALLDRDQCTIHDRFSQTIVVYD